MNGNGTLRREMDRGSPIEIATEVDIEMDVDELPSLKAAFKMVLGNRKRREGRGDTIAINLTSMTDGRGEVTIRWNGHTTTVPCRVA